MLRSVTLFVFDVSALCTLFVSKIYGRVAPRVSSSVYLRVLCVTVDVFSVHVGVNDISYVRLVHNCS
jgi:cell division protein FtsX